MSAARAEVGYSRWGLAGRLARLAGGVTLPMRAFLVSRLLVLAAGIAGAVSVPRRLDWQAFDPTHLTSGLGAVGNVLAAPAVRWDSIHYLDIARHGYARAASTAFYPVYPMLVRVVGYLLRSDVAAGIVISLGALAVALVLLHRLTELELGRGAADATVALLAFAPLSLFFSAVYTESLFLALSVGSLYAARRGRWKLACGLAAVAAATRVTGAGLLIPLAIMYVKERRGLDRGLLWLSAVPAGLLAYLGFLSCTGYAFLTPFLQENGSAYGRSMAGPLNTLLAAVQAAAAGAYSLLDQPSYQPSIGGPFARGAESIILLAVLAIALASLVVVFRRLPLAYGPYALLTLIVCIWSPVAGQPLKSVDRYVLTIFPLWMAAGAWLAERRLTRPVLMASVALLAFWTYQFATWAWVA